MTLPASTNSAAGDAAHRGRALLLALLVASICINYIDRGNLGVAAAAPALRVDLKLTEESLGLLFSMFFVTYASFQIVAGWLIDRYSVYVVFTVGFILWSAATIGMGLVNGFAGMLAWRLVLGVGEAGAYPAYSKIIAGRFAEHERGRANSLIDAGSRMGPAIGVVVGGLIAAHYGWRMIFISIGVVGLFWLAPWLWYAARFGAAERKSAAQVEEGPGLLQVLRRREAWGTFFGLFCLNYSWYFILSWLPSYLKAERHYSTTMVAWYGSLPFWAVAGTSLTFGWLSDRLIQRGGSPTKVRLACLGAGLTMNSLMIPAYLIQNQVLSMALMIAACLSLGVASSNLWAVTQTLAGRAAAGKWTGLQNAFGNIAGITSPYIAGLIVTKTGSFFMVFVSASLVALAGALSYWLVVRKVEPLRW
ncbi:MAG: MFS transporter [Bryobacterales bacterium]|nr:MFS transporter [Bryobacterales bacterium]